MITETGFIETFRDHGILKQPKEWNVESSEITITRPDGSDVSLATSSYIRVNDNIIHSNQDIDGITYDIPSDGDFNFILYSNEGNGSIPLGAASIGIENEILIIKMIQRVKSMVKMDIPQSNPNSLMKIIAIHERIPHPRRDLLQGSNKIEWQRVLLDQCIAKVKSQGYSKIRLLSGFASKYAGVGHDLSLSVQQYDFLVKNDKNWTPIDSQTKQGIDPKQRLNLDQAMKRVREKKIRTINEFGLKYPNLPIPRYWEKII